MGGVLAIGADEAARIPEERARRRGELLAFLAEHDVVCPGCGYGLRGLTGVQCPECGWVFDFHVLREQVAPAPAPALPWSLRWLTVLVGGVAGLFAAIELVSGGQDVRHGVVVAMYGAATALAVAWFGWRKRAVWRGMGTLGRLGIVWGLVVGAGAMDLVW